MRQTIKFVIWLLVIAGSSTMLTAQETLLIKTDLNCVDKYEYAVNGLSVVDKHISYHVKQNAFNKVILNTVQSDLKQVRADKESKIVDACAIQFTPELINQINEGKMTVYTVYKSGEVYAAQKVSLVIQVEENANYIRYASPYYSFKYDKNTLYDPAQRLAYGDNVNKQAQFFANDVASMGCYKTYNLIKVISETHPKRSFSMIANDDFRKMTTEQLLETCQKPLKIELAEGIGIIKETTVNCDIQLTAINGQSLGQFLTQKCDSGQPVNNTLASNLGTAKGGNIVLEKRDIPKTYYYFTSEPVFKMEPKTITNRPNFDFTENTTKGVSTHTSKKPGVYFYNVSANTADVKLDKIITTENTTKGVEVEEKAREVLTNKGELVFNIEYDYEGKLKEAQPVAENAVLHEVNNGETLYSISQKYKTTVDAIKKLNQLEDNTIFVTQQLRIK